MERGGGGMVVNQGDIHWMRRDEAGGSAVIHPYVIVQENVLNHSRIQTVVVCALTSNLKRAKSPGNVLLKAGEANLPHQSVVEVSKISTVDKTQLGETSGSLSEERIKQILDGMQFLQLMTGGREAGEQKSSI
jgi:mRNA interferase MazF